MITAPDHAFETLLHDYNLNVLFIASLYDEVQGKDSMYSSARISIENIRSGARYEFIGNFSYDFTGEYEFDEDRFYIECVPDENFRIRYIGKSNAILSLLREVMKHWVLVYRRKDIIDMFDKMC